MEATERLTFNPGLPRATRRADSPAEPVAAAAAAPARTERYDLLAYRLLLFFTFVLIFRPQDMLPVLDPLHLAELSGTAAVIALIAGRASRGRPFVNPSRELILVLAFAAWMLITAPLSVWPGGAVTVFTDLFSKVLVIFALIINTVTTRDRFEKLVLVIGAGTSYMAVRAVSDYFRGLNLIEGDRIAGTGGLFGNPNDMALNMVAFLPLAIVIALMRKGTLGWAIGLIGVPLICATIIFTKSRGGMIGLVIMVAIFLFKIRSLRPGLGALILAAAIATVPMLPESFTARMASIFNSEEDPTGSREARKQLLREGYQTYLDHPLFGVGAGQFLNYSPDGRSRYVAWRETHNAPLQVAAELGTPGLIIFVLMIWSGFAAARNTTRMLRARAPAHPRRRGLRLRGGEHERLTLYAAGFTASLAGWIVAAMFASVAYYWTLYLVVGLAIALRDIVKNNAGLEPAPVTRRQVSRR